jgi:hypothetical protein
MVIKSEIKMVKIIVTQDRDLGSPRDWDNIGTIAYKSSTYNLGEEKISDPIDWLQLKLNLSDSQMRNILLKNDLKVYYCNEMKDLLQQRFFKEYIALPVYLYDHSGQSISTSPFSCNWDSEPLGYIYCTKQKAIKEYGNKKMTSQVREKTLKYMQGEIEIFNQYLQGDAYYFEVQDEEGNELDSCGGFFGTDWEDNGILDHINYEGYGLKKEETLTMLEEAYNNI